MVNNISESKKFGIPLESLRKPIAPELLRLFGISSEANQGSLFMNPVLIEGYSYGGGATWSVSARSGHKEDDPSVPFGNIQITSSTGSRIEPTEVLAATEDWIRNSENTEWVPGRAVTLPIPEEMSNFAIAGLILVRATNR